jgi:hypothetical protein
MPSDAASGPSAASARSASAHGAPVDEPPAARLAAEADVLGDRAVAEEVDLLVHRDHARGLRGGRRVEAHRPAVEPDRAGVAAVGAGHHLDERALAGAVLADERVRLAGGEREVDGVERRRAGEALRDPLHAEEGLGVGRHLAPGRRRGGQ